MKKLIAILAVMCILGEMITVNASTQSVSADVEADGGYIAIAGKAGRANTDVVITVHNQEGKSVKKLQTISDSTGSFGTVVALDENASAGTYTVTAAVAEVQSLSEEFDVIAASVNLDGKYVTVNGTVSSGADKMVSIIVENENDDIVYINQMTSDQNGEFNQKFALAVNLKGTVYSLSLGAEGISTPTVITFEYVDKATEIFTNKFAEVDLTVELSSYVPILTGTASCTQGKTANIVVTNVTDNTVIANDTITYEDGVKELNYTFPSLLSAKTYVVTITVTDGVNILTAVNAEVDSSVIFVDFSGAVVVADNAYLDVQFETVNTDLVSKESTITDNSDFSASIPNVISNSSYMFSIQGYEKYTRSMITAVKSSENTPLYTALKNARPELDHDNDGIITSSELASINGMLDISNSGISTISGLGQCVLISGLNISGNNISTLAPLETMTNLEYLWAEDNILKDLHGIPANIRYINASDNEIAGLLGLKDAAKLEVLISSHNKILSADGLENKMKLKYLKINNNEIEDISALEQCVMLVHIDLSDNYVTDIKALGNLQYVKYLDLQNNGLSDVRGLPANSYYTLKLSGNNISQLPEYESIYR